MAKNVQWYGWIKQAPDPRDQKLTLELPPEEAQPPVIDWESKFPPIINQSNLGSCTGCSTVSILAMREGAQGEKMVALSALMAYFNGRKIENTINEDSGCQIRDVIKGTNKWGVCAESLFPYNTAHFKNTPSAACYTEAKHHEAITYQTFSNASLNTVKGVLAAGHPFVFGFNVYSSFESDAVAKTGIMPMPLPGEQIEGGHAVACVGYDVTKQHFKVRNSWGSDWGDHGYFWMPFMFMTDTTQCSDFWHIDLVSK